MKMSKKVFFMALMIWTLIMGVSYAATAEITTSEGARLRRSADTSSDVLTVIDKGETVTILNKEGEWYEVEIDNTTGYIRGDLLKVNEEEPVVEEQTQEPAEEPEEQEEPEKQPEEPEKKEETKESEIIGYQVKKDVPVHVLPNLSSSVLGEFKAETMVTVVKKLNAWSAVKFNNRIAWIPSALVKEVHEEEQAEPQEELQTKTGYVNVAGAIIRSQPIQSEDTIITEWGRNKPVEIIGEEGEWYKILFDGEEAYVAKRLISDSIVETSRGFATRRETTEQEEYVILEETETTQEPIVESVVAESVEEPVSEISWKTVYVNVASANIRAEANTSSQRVGSATRKDALEVTSENEEWYRVKREDGSNAYIAKRLVVDNIEDVVIPEPVVETKTEVEPQISSNEVTGSTTGEKVVALAKQYLGCSYTYGGSGPKSFDCSGFTMYIFKQFGVSLPHNAATQANYGSYVEKANLKPGDLVIFRDYSNTSIGHAGIYIGGGNFIHAANPNSGVKIDALSSNYYSARYVCARRLV